MLIDSLLHLTPDQQRASLVAEAEHGNISIHEQQGYRWLSTSAASIQSIMRIDAPAALILPNHIAMLIGLLVAESPQRVLNLGFGIGSFERYFNNLTSAFDIVSVDNNATIVDLARAHFCVPRDWPVRIQSADDCLEQCDRVFDLILCDLFTGDHHADCLFEDSFFKHVRQHLTGGGVLALNLSTRSKPELLAILLAVRQSFRWVMLVKIPQHGNIVLLACKRTPPSDAQLAQRARQSAAKFKLDFSAALEQLERIPPPD